MDGARSICLIYARENAFEACYLKGFFKMTGFSYVNYLYRGDGKDDLGIFRNSNFDIVVNIDGTMPEIIRNTFVGRTGTHYCVAEVTKDEKALLRSLSVWISKALRRKGEPDVFMVLAEIYMEEGLAALFYDYTLVLQQKMKYTFALNACHRLEKALVKINRLMSRKNKAGLEYVLYAKYACAVMINAYLLAGRQIERYDIGELLENISEIYRYDENFYKAEYLKALAANQNCMYNALPGLLFTDCIDKCPLRAGKSHFYYGLGNWYKERGRYDAALGAYRASYQINPNNIKAAFKLAVEAKRRSETGRAKTFLQQIIDIWENWGDVRQIPLRDIEYAYKARKLFAVLVDRIYRKRWEEKAEHFMEEVRPEKYMKTGQEPSFAQRLYASYGEDYIREVLNTMCGRVDLLYVHGILGNDRNGR